MQYRNVEDQDGRQYVFYVSKSVAETAMVTAQRGKLIAFREALKAPWKVLDGKSSLRFKHLNIGKPLQVNVDLETWKDLVASKMPAYVDLGFDNRPKPKITVGLEVQSCDVSELRESKSGELYKIKTVQCNGRGCNRELIGRQFYRFKRTDDGLLITGAGRFVPNDINAQRMRHKSKSWFCADCAVKFLKSGSQQELPLGEAASELPPPPARGRLDIVIGDIEEMLSPASNVDPVFVRGAIYALTKLRPFLRP